MDQWLKVVLPWGLVLFWLAQSRMLRRHRAALAGLYLTCFAGFASNFTPYYREIGQVVGIVVSCLTLWLLYRRGRVLRVNRLFAGFAFFITVSLAARGITPSAQAAVLNFISVVLVVNFLYLRLDFAESLLAFMSYYVRLAVLLGGLAVVEWIIVGGRAEVTFANTNYLGFFLGPAACAALCFPNIRYRWASWMLIAAGIYVTGSRAAISFPVFSLLAFFTFGGTKTFVWAVPLVALLSLVLLFAPQPESLTGRTGVEGSDIERYTAMEAGLEMIRHNPVVGVGWGRFQEEFWTYLDQAPSLLPGTGEVDVALQRDVVSHNDLVRVFAEMGVFAGLFFCWLTGFAIYTALKFANQYKSFLLAVLAGSIVFSLTHNNLNSTLFWYLFLMPVALYYRQRRIGLPATMRRYVSLGVASS